MIPTAHQLARELGLLASENNVYKLAAETHEVRSHHYARVRGGRVPSRASFRTCTHSPQMIAWPGCLALLACLHVYMSTCINVCIYNIYACARHAIQAQMEDKSRALARVVSHLELAEMKVRRRGGVVVCACRCGCGWVGVWEDVNVYAKRACER